MGSNDALAIEGDGEGPVREVSVAAFAIAAIPVTNWQFAEFIAATGYVTDAERAGWSNVFHMLIAPNLKRDVEHLPRDIPWWYPVPGAFWSSPEGPGSSVEDRRDHPVVQVSWNDAEAYCEWAQTLLPSEAQWERAARGGHEGRVYPWGDELQPDGFHRCNVWQGKFPYLNAAEDGWLGTAPVEAYEPNDFGLYQMIGNVWEWCRDSFSPAYHLETATSDPLLLAERGRKSLRGGSFLCHDSYCRRYRCAARSSNTPDSAASNIGFRVVRALE